MKNRSLAAFGLIMLLFVQQKPERLHLPCTLRYRNIEQGYLFSGQVFFGKTPDRKNHKHKLTNGLPKGVALSNAMRAKRSWRRCLTSVFCYAYDRYAFDKACPFSTSQGHVGFFLGRRPVSMFFEKNWRITARCVR